MDNTENTVLTKGAEPRSYSFGQFILDVDRGTLLKDGKDIPLRPKCFEVLKYLVRHHGVLVSKDEIFATVWAGVVVTEDSLTQCLIRVRKALDDTSKEIVRTVPRRGYLFDIPVTVHERVEGSSVAKTRGSARRNRKPSRWTVSAVILLTVAIAATWWSSNTKQTDPSVGHRIASPNSIAVLPFVDMSPAGDQEYFADGLSEELLNLLAQIPDLQVIARTSSFSFKGQNLDIQTIADKLNVANVLEGSVRKDGNEIRVTAQLVSASDSAHLWSQTYDRTLDNVFAVQSEIAGSVANVLKVKLLDEPFKSTGGKRDPAAWVLLLKGKFFYSRRSSGDIERAIAHYRQALEIDPGLAEAWVGLAATMRIQAFHAEIPWDYGWGEIKTMLDKALELDPDNAEAHIRLSSYYWVVGEDGKRQQHFERALHSGQNSALVMAIASSYAAWVNDIEQAIDYQRRAVALDPLGYANSENLATVLFYGGHFHEARDQCLTAAALNPEYSDFLNRLIGLTLIMQKQYGVAEDIMQQLPPGAERDHGMALIHAARDEQSELEMATARLAAENGFNSAYYLAEISSFQGDREQAFRWLQEAMDRMVETDPEQLNSIPFRDLKFSPLLATIHEDPRWSEWLSSAEDWRVNNILRR